MQFYQQNISSIFVYLKSLYLIVFPFEGYLCKAWISRSVVLFFQHFKYFLHSLFACMEVVWNLDIIFIFIPLWSLFLFPVFFSLCFLVLKVSIIIFSSSKILSSAVSNLLMSPLKALFLYVTMFCISIISFWFLEFSPLCLHYPFVLLCYLLFPLKPLCINQ